jgi:hypothetical protein
MAADALVASLQLDIGHLRAQMSEVHESCRSDLQLLERAIQGSEAEAKACLDEQMGVGSLGMMIALICCCRRCRRCRCRRCCCCRCLVTPMPASTYEPKAWPGTCPVAMPMRACARPPLVAPPMQQQQRCQRRRRPPASCAPLLPLPAGRS